MRFAEPTASWLTDLSLFQTWEIPPNSENMQYTFSLALFYFPVNHHAEPFRMIGAALFFVLGRFVAIPSPVPNTNISMVYGTEVLKSGYCRHGAVRGFAACFHRLECSERQPLLESAQLTVGKAAQHNAPSDIFLRFELNFVM